MSKLNALLHFVVTLLLLGSNFLFIINSTSNALYVNQLKITEGSVETWL